MSERPTFSERPSFLGLPTGDAAAPICIAGIPLDIGTTNRAAPASGQARSGRRAGCWWMALIRLGGSSPRRCRRADIGDFRIALGDIPASLAADRGAGVAARSSRRARAASTASPCRCCAR